MSCTSRWVRVSASPCARRSSSWLTSFTTSRTRSRSSSRTTAEDARATTTSTTALVAISAQPTPLRTKSAARNAAASAAVAAITRLRRESAESATSRAKKPRAQPALNWGVARGAPSQSRRKTKTTSSGGEAMASDLRSPRPRLAQRIIG